MLEKPPLNHSPLIPVILNEFKLNLLLRLVTEIGRQIGREGGKGRRKGGKIRGRKGGRGREGEGQRERKRERMRTRTIHRKEIVQKNPSAENLNHHELFDSFRISHS